MCQTSVKYFGLIVSEGTKALGEDRIGPISTYPLPKTLKQLRGFLGITSYCRLWIPGYGEIARPLYHLIKETQAANTHLLLWNPETEQAFSLLKQVFFKCPSLQPSHWGKSFHLYITEEKE